MDAGIYKKTIKANGCLFKWNANLVFIFKPGQVQLCLTLNYNFIYGNILASYIKAATIVHNLLSILLYQCLFLVDIKHRYWVINIYSDNCYYFVFHIPGIRQI